VEALVADTVSQVIQVRAEGDGDLAQLLDLILFGDFVSLWLAANHGVDPGPVEVLVQLKQDLAGG
jgi:glucose/mannose-6-phosphate isomerase